MTDVTRYHAVENTPTGETVIDHRSSAGQGPNRGRFDVGYVKSQEGILKIAEIIFSLIVFICATVAIRERPVFYGCAVWAAVVGFFSFLFTTIWLVLNCLRVPASATKVPWKIIATAYAAVWAVFFLIAGVTLTVVAESAITRPRVTYYTSSVYGDHTVLSADKGTALPPLPESGFKREWLIQRTEGNYDEFRPATAGAVFAFATCLVYAFDAFLANSQRAREAAALKRTKNGVAV